MDAYKETVNLGVLNAGEGVVINTVESMRLVGLEGLPRLTENSITTKAGLSSPVFGMEIGRAKSLAPALRAACSQTAEWVRRSS